MLNVCGNVTGHSAGGWVRCEPWYSAGQLRPRNDCLSVQVKYNWRRQVVITTQKATTPMAQLRSAHTTRLRLYISFTVHLHGRQSSSYYNSLGQPTDVRKMSNHTCNLLDTFTRLHNSHSLCMRKDALFKPE